jgi:tetratricopeptide (TPR) repeat protein
VGRFEDATLCYERALAAKRESLGSGHASVGNTLYNLAFLALDRGLPEEAAEYLKETLDIYMVRDGVDLCVHEREE